MNQFTRFFDQPKAIFLLSFVELWNRFSHYGMRALLVLFMVNFLKFSPSYAFGIYAVFCALVELGGVLGAYFSDHFLGLRRTILLGGWIIATGHASLAMNWFFPGLALLIIGSSLFTTNITALIGEYYTPKDPRRTSGFTLFYMSINVGALFATLLCGYLAEQYGWEYGFGLASFGMMIANFALHKFKPLLEGKGEATASLRTGKKMRILPLLIIGGALACLILIGQRITLPLLPFLAVGMGFFLLRSLLRKMLPITNLSIMLAAAIVFFSAQEQIGSSLVVFADQKTMHTLFGFSISPTAIIAFNPIIIILGGALSSALLKQIRSPFVRISFPFLITAGALIVLLAGQLLLPRMPISSLMGIVAVISFAELFIGPMVYSTCSEISTQAKDPKIMGLVPIASSLAALLGGGISKVIAHTTYTQGFMLLSLLMSLCGITLGIIQTKRKEAA